MTEFKTRGIGRFPRLDTILMVEKALFRYKSDKTITQIWKLLPKSVMWTTFTTILDYLEYLGKIHVEKDKTVTWLWNPEGVLHQKKISTFAASNANEDNTQNNINKIKNMILPMLKREGVVRASIFGSTARGEANKDSDIDLLVAFGKKKVSLFGLGGLKTSLEEKLGRKVDIVEYAAVDLRLKKSIFSEKVDIL